MEYRPWVKWLSKASLIGLAVYAMLTMLTLAPTDRSMFGIGWLDARPVYVVTALLALAAAEWHRVRPLWLIVMPITTVGRASSLIFLGSPDLARAAEIRSSFGWLLLFLLGVLSVMVLEAAEVIHESALGDT